RQEGLEIATYDDACNIGYCSINGATIGGWGANYTTVSTLVDFSNAVSASGPGVIIVEGAISGDAEVIIGSSKSIVGIGLYLNGSRNVILRNLKIANAQGPAVSIENSRSIWVDHCDLSSQANQGSETDDSLIRITRGSDYLTVTGTVFRDHSQAVLVGHADSNGEEDKGKFHVTFARNYFQNVESAISYRFGTGHIFNSYYENVVDGINTRMGAELLIESSVFEESGRAVFSENSTEIGYATIRDVMFGDSSSSAPAGNMTSNSVPYPYDWYVWETDQVRASVVSQAGQKLEFLVWD
ncbi:Pectate lyase A, partial [Madurella mycetomatis]